MSGACPARRRRRLRDEGGFTLIETLVAAVVLSVGLIALLGFIDTASKASLATKQREQATNVARQVLEDARGIPYAQISPTTIVAQLQAMPGLTNVGSGSSWQVRRPEKEGTLYTITLKECSIDDGKGGVWGVHKNQFGENPFCKDAGEKEYEGKAGETADPQPEDLKRITVDVTWTAKGRSPVVHEVETLSAASGTPGLNATGLQLETPAPDAGTKTAPVITKPSTASLTFSVSSPTGTASMRWSLEGIAQPNAPTLKEGTTWTFSWAIPDPGVLDGTYNVAVQAIDKRGVLGPPVSIQVTLVRNVPAAVKGLKGGFNEVTSGGVKKKVAEFLWKANEERNVIGYRVYKPGATRPGEAGLACPSSLTALNTATSCVDFSPPEPKAANLTYTVTALYRNAENAVVEGTPATITIVAGPPPAPNPPTELKLTKNLTTGAVELEWKAPTSGETPIFYRIYRGSSEYGGRYDQTAGTETKYVDGNAVEAHRYWVTAVDANLTESTPLGWVEG